MTDDLEKKINELEELIKCSLCPAIKKEDDSPTAKSFLSKHVALLVTMLTMTGGLIVSWTTQQSTIAQLKEDVKELYEQVKENDQSIQTLQLKTVADSSDLGYIKAEVITIRGDIKKLLEGKNK